MIYEKSVFHIVRWVCFSVPVCVWGSVTVRSRYGLIHHRRVTALGSSKKKRSRLPYIYQLVSVQCNQICCLQLLHYKQHTEFFTIACLMQEVLKSLYLSTLTFLTVSLTFSLNLLCVLRWGCNLARVHLTAPVSAREQ